jgi:hypothetical protein
MRSIRQPLDDLLKDNEWTWSARCKQAFESIKALLILISSSLTMIHHLK